MTPLVSTQCPLYGLWTLPASGHCWLALIHLLSLRRSSALSILSAKDFFLELVFLELVFLELVFLELEIYFFLLWTVKPFGQQTQTQSKPTKMSQESEEYPPAPPPSGASTRGSSTGPGRRTPMTPEELLAASQASSPTPTKATQPSTEATKATEASAKATEASAKATQPTAEATQPTADAASTRKTVAKK